MPKPTREITFVSGATHLHKVTKFNRAPDSPSSGGRITTTNQSGVRTQSAEVSRGTAHGPAPFPLMLFVRDNKSWVRCLPNLGPTALRPYGSSISPAIGQQPRAQVVGPLCRDWTRHCPPAPIICHTDWREREGLLGNLYVLGGYSPASASRDEGGGGGGGGLPRPTSQEILGFESSAELRN